MANATTDHEEIRRWAESKGGKPAAVDRTHHDGDVGIVRIMFPDNPQSEHKALVEISWDEFFEQFEESQLALLYEENSLFSKIVGRDTVEHREHGEHTSRRQMREEGGASKGSGGSSGGGKAETSAKGGGKESGGRSEGAKAKAGTSGKSGGKESGGESGGGEADDLKSREYRDEQGNVHHHTRAYMEGQGNKK